MSSLDDINNMDDLQLELVRASIRKENAIAKLHEIDCALKKVDCEIRKVELAILKREYNSQFKVQNINRRL